MYRSLLSKAALFVSVVTVVSFSMVEKSCVEDLVLPPMDVGANDWQLHKSSRSSARDGISDSFMVVLGRDLSRSKICFANSFQFHSTRTSAIQRNLSSKPTIDHSYQFTPHLLSNNTINHGGE